MTIAESTKQQIYQVIETLPEKRLPEVLRLLKEFLKVDEPKPTPGDAFIYQMHQQAIETGIPDLAHNHDHYLYNVNKRDD